MENNTSDYTYEDGFDEWLKEDLYDEDFPKPSTVEEINAVYHEKGAIYYRLLESEKIANEILKKHGKIVCCCNENFKKEYQRFLRTIDFCKIYDPFITYEVTLDDIIARIEETCAEEVNYIDENQYKYNDYYGSGDFNVPHYHFEPFATGADIKIAETYELYSQIIKETNEKYSNKSHINKRTSY